MAHTRGFSSSPIRRIFGLDRDFPFGTLKQQILRNLTNIKNLKKGRIVLIKKLILLIDCEKRRPVKIVFWSGVTKMKQQILCNITNIKVKIKGPIVLNEKSILLLDCENGRSVKTVWSGVTKMKQQILCNITNIKVKINGPIVLNEKSILLINCEKRRSEKTVFCFGVTKMKYNEYLKTTMSPDTGVADPWHFGLDPGLDPRIHASD